MTKVIQQPKQPRMLSLRIFAPNKKELQKSYKDINQMKRWRTYYKNKGFTVREV